MMSFNMEGFRRNGQYLSSLLSESRPKLVFLQEIWLPYSLQYVINGFHPQYSFKISSPDMFKPPEDLLVNSSHVWHGAALGWSKDIGANIHPIESTYDRFVGVRLQLPGSSVILISLYASTAGRDEEFLELISYLTEYLLRNLAAGEKLVIGADVNCSDKSTLRRQQAWKNFCEFHELKNYRSQYPSFHHNNGTSSSFIDLFAASSSLGMSDILQHCTLETPLNLSSHDPIETTVDIPIDEPKESKFSNTYENFNRRKVIWDVLKLPGYQELAAKALTEALMYWDTPESLPLLSSLLSSLLVSCAFESKSANHKVSPKLPSEAIRQAQNNLKKLFKS